MHLGWVHPFTVLCGIPLYDYYSNLFIRLTARRHLSCFPFGAVTNISVNILVHAFGATCIHISFFFNLECELQFIKISDIVGFKFLIILFDFHLSYLFFLKNFYFIGV